MKQFEKESLGLFPTPLYRLPNLSRELGTNIWIKRDDLCGVALGGNKVRKLEYLLRDAKNQGYDLVMTTGQAQSNHAMLTAACALRMGLDCILVLKERGVTARKGNQILNHLMGVEVRYMDTDSYEDIYREMDRIGDELGRKVYKIPCGGSNALGTLGYIDCMKEVADSMVDNDPFEEIVPRLMEEAAELLGIDLEIPVPDLLPMWGPGYSIPSAEGNEAIALMMRLEGIVLDTCYTGKAFAGLIRRAREGFYKPTDNVLFVHTGGAGGLFAQDWEA